MEFDEELICKLDYEELTDEEKKAINDLTDCYNRIFILSLKREYNLDVTILDNYFVSFNGSKMTYTQFADMFVFDEKLAEEDNEVDKQEEKHIWN